MTFAEITEQYLDYLKKTRTEQYWQRQEKVLRDEVLPNVGAMLLPEVYSNMMSSILNVPNLPETDQIKAHRVMNATNLVIGWAIENIPRVQLQRDL
jgi:hypothetical protein